MPSDKKHGRRMRRSWKWVWGGVLGLILILSSGTYVLYNELEPTQHFTQNTIPTLATPSKVIPQTKTASVSQPQAPVQEVSSHPATGSAFNLLILGVDSRQPGQPGRTDSILVIHADLTDHQYQVISIPRDSRVDLPQYGYTKITHANYMGELNGSISTGTMDTIQAVSNLTGLTINYYAETSFQGLTNIVNSLGGIDIYLPFNVSLPDYNGKMYQKGTHHVDGATLLALTRERYSLSNGDFGRQQIQEEALIAMAKKLLEPSNLKHAPAIISQLKQFLVTTNLTSKDFLSLALAARHFKSSDVHYYQVPGHPGVAKDPILGINLDYWIVNQSQLNQIIKAHFE